MIICEKKGPVALLYLNDPSRLNVLSIQLIAHLNNALDDLEKDDNIRVVILTANGKVFCAGADLKQVKDYNPETDVDFIDDWRRINSFSKPIISALNGVAAGGGLELSLMTDMIFACESARLGCPEVSVGVIPGCGATQILPRIIGLQRASYLCMTAELISANLAYDWGLIQGVFSDDSLQESVYNIAIRLSQYSLPILKKLKKALKSSYDYPLNDGIKIERSLFNETFILNDHHESMNAFFEKRKPLYDHKTCLGEGDL